VHAVVGEEHVVHLRHDPPAAELVDDAEGVGDPGQQLVAAHARLHERALTGLSDPDRRDRRVDLVATDDHLARAEGEPSRSTVLRESHPAIPRLGDIVDTEPPEEFEGDERGRRQRRGPGWWRGIGRIHGCSSSVLRRRATPVQRVNTKPRDTSIVDNGEIATADDVRDAYLANSSVHRNLDDAERMALGLTASRSPEARAVALWTLGKVHYEKGRLADAQRAMRRATRISQRAGLAGVEGAVWLSLAALLVEAGHTSQALGALDRAEPLVEGVEVGRLVQQRAFVLFHLGEWDDAIDAADRALRLMRAAGDEVGEARLLLLRGVCHLGAGSNRAATADLVAARSLADRIDERLISALAEQDLGCAYGRLGDIPTALGCFDRARDAYERSGGADRLETILDADLAETLLLGGLASDAIEAADRSAASAAAAGNVVNEAEAKIMLARALLVGHRYADASDAARQAARLLRRSRRIGWGLYASYIDMQAVVEQTKAEARPPLALLRRAVRLADQLQRHGWRNESLHVRTYVGRLALARDDRALAVAQLRPSLLATRTGHVAARANAHHAVALLRLAEGDRTGARRSVATGLDLIERHRAVVGASELRAGIGVHGVELARLGFKLSLDGGRQSAILAWSERWRAASLRSAPARPSDDQVLADSVGELRQLHVVRHDRVANGLPTDVVDGRIRRVERTIAQRARQAVGTAGGDAAIPSKGELEDRLGERVMLVFTELEGRLWLQRLGGAPGLVCDLGSSARVHAERAFLSSAMRQLLALGHHEPSRAAAEEALRLASRRLDALLLGAAACPSDASVVIVPTGQLSKLAWAALPSLASREVVVSPSATLWYQRAADHAHADVPARVGLVAGPDLPGARAELRALRRLYPSAVALSGRDANSRAVLELLASNDLVHLAAHGRFRGDNPLFSNLRLVDGPLTVYDLQRLSSTPRSIVMPACSAATALVMPGDELLGTAVALLHLGTASLVAPIDAVDDALTSEVMVDLHRAVANGASMGSALRDARLAAGERGRRAWATAVTFVCLGV
jgi:tetratricopeptide (TPR) repeat protein